MQRFLKRNFIRSLALAAVLVFISGCLSACTQIQFADSLGSGVLFAVDDEQCTLAEAILRLYEDKSLYETNTAVDAEGNSLEEAYDEKMWSRKIGDSYMAAYVKDGVRQEMLYYIVSRFIADDLAIYLTEEDRTAAEEAGLAAYSAMNDKYDLDDYSITEQTAIDLYTNEALYDKVFDYLAAIVNTEISTSDTKVIEVNYVLIPSGDKDAEDIAEEIRQSVKAGSDIDVVSLSRGYTAQINQIIRKGDMNSDFEKVAYALTDNEISDVVSSTDGYYVIQCVEDYMPVESVLNNNEVLSNARREKFEETYNEYAADRKLRFDEETWDKIDIRKLS